MKYSEQLKELFGSKYVIHRDSDGIKVIPLFVGKTYSGRIIPWNDSASMFGVVLWFKSSRALMYYVKSLHPLFTVKQSCDTELVLSFDYKDWDTACTFLKPKRRKSSFLGNVENIPSTPAYCNAIARITIGV